MKKFFKIALISLAGLLAVPVVVLFFLYQSADMGQPQVVIDPAHYTLRRSGDTILCRGSYLRYDSCGLWELYVEGSGQERGAKQGALTKELMKYQEDVFIDQIREIVPSDSYLKLLRNFIVIFNRNMGEHVPPEYRDEIAAMATFCTHEYDIIGTPYERQLNYHAAHDIGHAMQQYMLVGCSSFGVWGERSETGSLVVGRNFDFYVGDDFAKNRMLTFATPDTGYRYASIGWAGMVGVLSGMNECGLTVTINAAKGAIPISAATPISILTREILQYASTIEEALDIARSHKTFVSESILVGSVKDGKSAIIEKTPKQTALYSPHGERVICTNHFQSAAFAEDGYNVDNIANSDSRYRYDRIAEMLDGRPAVDYKAAAEILRNRLGQGDEDIGLGNEMAINQSIAHHSVVFMPEEGLMWVSTAPWQSGRIVCYDLGPFFRGEARPARLPQLDIAADSAFLAADYPRLLMYREQVARIKDAIKHNQPLDEGSLGAFMELNPQHYYTYRLMGDYYHRAGDRQRAAEMYRKALTLTTYRSKRTEIEKLINKLGK